MFPVNTLYSEVLQMQESSEKLIRNMKNKLREGPREKGGFASREKSKQLVAQPAKRARET